MLGVEVVVLVKRIAVVEVLDVEEREWVIRWWGKFVADDHQSRNFDEGLVDEVFVSRQCRLD